MFAATVPPRHVATMAPAPLPSRPIASIGPAPTSIRLFRLPRHAQPITLEPLYAVLADNRIQAMIVEPFDYPAIETAAWRAQTALLEFDDPPVAHGLVMSRRSLDDARRAAWQALVRAMREDGTVQRIFEKYFPVDLARSMTRF